MTGGTAVATVIKGRRGLAKGPFLENKPINFRSIHTKQTVSSAYCRPLGCHSKQEVPGDRITFAYAMNTKLKAGSLKAAATH